MKFYTFISIILHPIVIPTVGVLLYFMLVSNNLESQQKMAVLGLIFVATYLIPLCILFIFKKLNFISSFNADKIKERKIPVAIMLVLFYLLGNTFNNIPYLRDLGILFFGTSLGLICIYVLFVFKLKTSIHLLSLGISTSFFIVLELLYPQSFLIVIIVSLFLSGIVASARLHLKAHTTTEVYLGFFLGFFAPLIVYYIL